ncbi:MAG: hypothetical protein GX358_08865 [candidate division WS1 bacterium]|nr:hypothetical protein [candidate division WS1 bacterium]
MSEERLHTVQAHLDCVTALERHRLGSGPDTILQVLLRHASDANSYRVSQATRGRVSVLAQFWQPAHAFAPSGTPSWVWDQLPRAITEYRGLLLDRLWEWWIGALVLEHDSV